MKKYLFLLIIPILFLIPKDTFARSYTTQYSGTAVYFINQGSIPNTIGTGYLPSFNDSVAFPSSTSAYVPPADYDNYIYYSVKQIGIVNTTYSFIANNTYTIRLDFYVSDNMVSSYVLWDLNKDTSCSSVTAGDSISCTWEYKQNLATAVITFIPISDRTGTTFDLGNVNNYGSMLFTNVSASNESLILQEATITYSDGADGTTDIINNDNKNTNSIINNQNQNQQQTNEKLDKIDGTLKDDDVSGAEDSASGFFNDFETDDFGLSSIITMPLEFINGLTSSTCYSLNLPLPFVDTNVTLPCMTSIYEKYFGTFFTLYQTITTGFIAYGVCVNIFRLVQGFKSPDNDVVEVMEL